MIPGRKVVLTWSKILCGSSKPRTKSNSTSACRKHLITLSGACPDVKSRRITEETGLCTAVFQPIFENQWRKRLPLVLSLLGVPRYIPGHLDPKLKAFDTLLLRKALNRLSPADHCNILCKALLIKVSSSVGSDYNDSNSLR